MEYIWTGTHTGPWQLPDGAAPAPTRKHLNLPAVSIFQLRGDEVIAHRMYWDQLHGLLRLGVVTLSEVSAGAS